jgi:serine-type D-Ala-D-Ala carboxypeptidase (penicillin-binding protein 5/6)
LQKSTLKVKFVFAMKLVYLAGISFFFIATSTLAISRFRPADFKKSEQRKSFVLAEESVRLPPIPVLINKSDTPNITAQSVLVTDIPSGVTLYEKNPDSVLLPASTTKIVTALVSMDYYHPDEVLTAGNEVLVDGQKMHLALGEKIKVNDLLYGLLVFSANDAAEVLATNYPGGRNSFIFAMNLKAKELHLENSTFHNPSGLDGTGHVTSARDLVRVSSVGMENPLFRDIVGTKEMTVSSVDGKVSHRLYNINELLGQVEGVLGVKTGWTPNSQENLVTYIEKDGKKIMIAVLGSQDRFGETRSLIDWVSENYEWKELDRPVTPNL